MESPRQFRRRGNSLFANLSAEEREAVRAKALAMKNLRWENDALPPEAGWGLSPGNTGFARPLAISAVSACVTVCTVAFGVVKYLAQLHKDVQRGIRCAPCSRLRPAARTFAATAAAAVAWLGASFALARWAVPSWPSRYAFAVSSERPKGLAGELQVLRSCVVYEGFQLVVSLVAVVSWIMAVGDLAQIDEPGDPMHLAYIHSGHAHYTRDQPFSDNNPLGLNGRRLARFHGVELFVMWSVVANAVLETCLRIKQAKTAYHPKLWLALDAVEIGTFCGVVVPRIFDAIGWTGSRVGGFSPFIALGLCRCLRLLRFERAVHGLFAVSGLGNVNGPLVRFATLIFKFLVTLMAMATVVCSVEFPCEPNARRHDNRLEAESCNPHFKDYIQCLYFLVVTLSTVGYGDMSPATREGRLVVLGIVIFILAFLPGVLSELHELSDGDDMSTADKTLAAVGRAFDEVLKTKHTLTGLKTRTNTVFNATTSLDFKRIFANERTLDDQAAQTILDKLHMLSARLEAVENHRKLRLPEDRTRRQLPHLSSDVTRSLDSLGDLHLRVSRLEALTARKMPRKIRRRDIAAFKKRAVPQTEQEDVRASPWGPFYSPSLARTLHAAMQEDGAGKAVARGKDTT